MYDRSPSSRPGGRRLAPWAAIIVTTAGLALLPQSLVSRCRQVFRLCLLPAQELAGMAVNSPGQTAQPDGELPVLAARRAELTAATDAALARLERQESADLFQQETLLVPSAIEARVIGRQGRSFFEHAIELNVGLADAVLPRAWVLDSSLPLVDEGHAAGVERGHLVLTGRRVWGQVREVGQQASIVESVTSAGYRDLVQLAGPSDNTPRPAARGILEGNGQPLCRIRMVKVTEPVEAGDLVLSAGGDELLPTPLVYGRIVRAERSRGAVHWDLWMEPAATGLPDRVTVVRVSLNAARLARSAEEIRR